MAESSTDVTDAAEPQAAPGRGRTWADNRWLLYLAFVAVAFALSIPALNNRVYNSDEAYLATQAKMLNDGARLYEDTVARKPPVLPYLYACGFRLTASATIPPAPRL